jgi:hypothetical protein
MHELRISVFMLFPFDSLAVGLQAVALSSQKLAHSVATK